jgi:hypothetical protein
MRAEGRLLIRLVEVAIFNGVLRDDAARARGLDERCAAIARADLALSEDRIGRVES